MAALSFRLDFIITVMPWFAFATSSCFDEAVSVGPDIASQAAVGGHGSVSVVNGAVGDLWINWLCSESDNGPFATAWTAALNAVGADNFWWMNDDTHSMGLFKLSPSASVLLPYMGVSTRIAPSVGCDAGSSSQGKLSGDAGRAIVATCSSSRGGTASPQTLIEWTFTPSPYDVIDSSFVDGYSMPVRLEYKKADQEFNTILGTLNEADCSSGDGVALKDGNGNFAGCQSPCSSTNDPAACCAGAYSTPDTCHPGGTPVNAEVPVWCNAITNMFSKDNKRLGYCYAYDDEAGSITDHERGLTDQSAPRIKVTFCDYATGTSPSPPSPPSPPTPVELRTSPTPRPSSQFLQPTNSTLQAGVQCCGSCPCAGTSATSCMIGPTCGSECNCWRNPCCR